MNKKFYCVIFKNLNTESLNNYFDRNNCVFEEVILPTTPENAKNDLDNYLCEVCFCDEYEYSNTNEISDTENEKLNYLYYELAESVETVKDYDNENDYESEIIYRLNAIYNIFN